MLITEGAIPISIGTSLALETIIKADRPNPQDPNRDIPSLPINVNEYDTLYVNVTTLTRNLLGALDDPYSGLVRDLAEEIYEELGIIAELLPKNITMKLFMTDMNEIKRKLSPYLREVRTDKQKKMHKRLYDVRDSLVGFFKGTDKEVQIWGLKRLTVDRDTSLIITHEPINLIHRTQFTKLHLLESHTGKVKTERDFYSKFYPMVGMSLERIPFEGELLVIFGDKVMFKPMLTSYRRSVLNLSKTRKWTTMTTSNKVNKDMKLLNNLPIHNSYNDIHKKI